MRPLKIAILWHFHQPYYKKEDTFILPWVRMHAVKDYYDLPELFHEFPELKRTINVVPSLSMQIEEYISGKTQDTVQKLTLKDAASLDVEDKKEILRLFFMCNTENMIMPYPRYKELFERSQNKEEAIQNYSEQDWRDLQVWYNLTWFAEFGKQKAAVKRLFDKGSSYSEAEKQMMIEIQLELMAQIKPEMNTLVKLGQLELSVSPMYHPILPLLCDSKSALEAMPTALMPAKPFKYPADARKQITDAIKYIEHNYGFRPAGMWPSEGSVSDETLDLLADSGLRWAASDEEILAASLGDAYIETMKFFPQKFSAKSGDIALLFRDHHLSDAIGFVYSRWAPYDAASDFCRRLLDIRNKIIEKHGEDSLEHAVVPIILDGENCWEYYHNNGIDFRRELYKQLSNTDKLLTVTCSEAVQPEHCNFFPALKKIRAGSWINANFKIWIGHSEDRAAWTLLTNARKAYEEKVNLLSPEKSQQAEKYLHIAEGSDWFWWYGDEHISDTKAEFDTLFRWYIEQVYLTIGDIVPPDVFMSISEQGQKIVISAQKGQVKPRIDGKVHDESEWSNAGYYDASASMSAMHQIGELLLRLWFATDENKIYFRCDTTHRLHKGELIEINFLAPAPFKLIIKQNTLEISSTNICLSSFSFGNDDYIEFSFSKSTFWGSESSGNIEITIHTVSNDGELFYPRQGTLTLEL